jgi:Cdc6-like AAA superfamily ATPase
MTATNGSEEPAEREDGARRLELDAAITRAFSPAAPVDRRDLFAGRTEQIRTLMDVVNGRGEHAVIYGERGVGKTSLAGVGALIVSRPDLLAVKVNCAEKDTFETIWKKALSRITFMQTRQTAGFTPEVEQVARSAADRLPANPSSHDVEMAISSVAEVIELAVFIDEFDRVVDPEVHAKMADAIKTFSDQGLRVTVVLVGVADDVGQLIAEHESIERGLTQVHMPRMSTEELLEIISRGLNQVEMSTSERASLQIARLSQGLPHYTHLLAQEAAKSVIWSGDVEALHIDAPHVLVAMRRAVERSPQTLTKRYHSATSSSRGKTLYPDVLLAAALTTGDDLGYFAAGDVREPLRAITKRQQLDIPAFSPHLHTLCEEDRGAVLQRTGAPRRYRFRFSNPLLQPYVIMRALAEEDLGTETLDRFLAT